MYLIFNEILLNSNVGNGHITIAEIHSKTITFDFLDELRTQL